MFYKVGSLMVLPILMELQEAREGVTEEIIVEVMSSLNQEVGVELLKN